MKWLAVFLLLCVGIVYGQSECRPSQWPVAMGKVEVLQQLSAHTFPVHSLLFETSLGDVVRSPESLEEQEGQEDAPRTYTWRDIENNVIAVGERTFLGTVTEEGLEFKIFTTQVFDCEGELIATIAENASWVGSFFTVEDAQGQQVSRLIDAKMGGNRIVSKTLPYPFTVGEIFRPVDIDFKQDYREIDVYPQAPASLLTDSRVLIILVTLHLEAV